ncbi:MAG TPA: heavy metal translocating P-type ATPase metal-binding domain-containing protein [Chitinophagaceae bacterium]|nr:heavy metal translocating P-type ATPase metal-binding domain-containing protein [Chitinophagaceae bacterium]
MEDTPVKEWRLLLRKKTPVQCYHCGESCDTSISTDQKYFCCDGCKFVFQLLQDNGLCNYYELSEKPGIKVKGKFSSKRFAYLENEEVKKKLLRFADVSQCHVNFYLPQMHCASCIWLLENLHTIDHGIFFSKTIFQRKEVFIAFDPERISLRKVVELLAFIGYEPYISLNEDGKKRNKQINHKKIFRIGVAGFCFSNIMMLSFPEYFSSGNIGQADLQKVFSYLNLALSIPVFFYSANEFFISAWKGLRQKWLNIDAPIALAILVTFGRSVYEIVSSTGAGYLDSMSGIVFFMLVGRWFQDKTYDSFSFDRDYKSYFPLGVTLLKNGKEETSTISALKKGDQILVRQNEMIPADAVISHGEGYIDYSFVSGENNPVLKRRTELVYAGGKQLGGTITMEIVNPIDQSYITQLWNNDVFTRQKNKDRSFIHPWSRYFTLILFIIAGGAALYWSLNDPSKIWPSVTASLIVACPCSLLLSATFTFGNMLRHFGKNKFYLKNASVIEALSRINTIVFDKTGTLTHSSQATILYEGEKLQDEEINMIYSLVKESIHPLSRIIKQNLMLSRSVHPFQAINFKEIAGKGIVGYVKGRQVKLGSKQFIDGDHSPSSLSRSGEVYISINDVKKGVFKISNQYRDGVPEMIGQLSLKKYKLQVLSGDNAAEKSKLQSIFGKQATIRFHQSPQEKLNFINELKTKDSKAKVLMLGDGLNDAGALRQSDVGVAVSENTSQFSPACDAIMDSNEVSKLHRFIQYARSGRTVITWSFILSILYNIVGLSFSVQGLLSPLIAAILMPVSSISIVTFVTLATSFSAKRKGL